MWHGSLRNPTLGPLGVCTWHNNIGYIASNMQHCFEDVGIWSEYVSHIFYPEWLGQGDLAFLKIWDFRTNNYPGCIRGRWRIIPTTTIPWGQRDSWTNDMGRVRVHEFFFFLISKTSLEFTKLLLRVPFFGGIFFINIYIYICITSNHQFLSSHFFPSVEKPSLPLKPFSRKKPSAPTVQDDLRI